MDSQLAQSTAIRRALRDWLAGRQGLSIASFASLPGEPMLLPLLADLPGHRWFFPRVSGGSMEFHLADAATFSAGPFGILEPPAGAPTTHVREIDVFLCPGMGFTASGSRIGRGKGYYDRALASSRPDAIRIGVCFNEQVLAEIPTDPHDQPMHFLATPAGVVACR